MVIVVFVLLICAFFFWQWRRLQPYNQKPLWIKTFDGLNSPYHPSVVFFDEGWNGWRYWMVETPFSPLCHPYRDKNECPSVHVSNDGLNWTDPLEGINPLVSLTPQSVLGFDYYSDPHLVKVGNRLECFFRLTRRHGQLDNFTDVSLCRIYSENGIDWHLVGCKVWNKPTDIVSPAITYSEEDGYQMWFVDSENHYGVRHVQVCMSNDGLEWSTPVVCRMVGLDINPWHIDVQYIGGILYMTVYDYSNVTLWRNVDGASDTFEYIQTILTPAHNRYGSFYCNGLYRSCLVDTDKGIELFFSADDSLSTYIGRMICPRPGMNSHGPWRFSFATESGLNASWSQFLLRYIGGYNRKAIFVVKNLYRHLYHR